MPPAYFSTVDGCSCSSTLCISTFLCVYVRVVVRAHAGMHVSWQKPELLMSREKSTDGQDGVEMGERSTLGQKPGYNGLCSYAQKITSCFGLDGKPRVGRKEGGVVQGAEITSWNILLVFDVWCLFYLRIVSEVVFFSASVCCFCALGGWQFWRVVLRCSKIACPQ